MKNTALFNQLAQDIVESAAFAAGKTLFSHGSISIYEHSLAVAQLSFALIEERGAFDKRCVVRAALLHDFFLYEWHIPGKRYLFHGWRHPAIAAENARQLFGISDKEYSCILTHMWPWTLFHPPRYPEGWIIALADKIVAFKEALICRGKRHPLQDPQAAKDF
jgi:uncharacterized protein